MRALQAELARLGGGEMGIALKLETARAFEQLPDLLVAAMRSPVVGSTSGVDLATGRAGSGGSVYGTGPLDRPGRSDAQQSKA